ncbi:hypothetical protein M011DRAFT_239812 [Sporormia fimetaria CBS 119925]|uniref:Uncharacterized protein n=1 Tax=Sporormia fimetaria CBS 119925 TaxID=1340428 RepID=A0A6A6VKP7_9PLEO|nr:hypothetical protein M011DRAFT_239812 [Sporormia fimetaria CBS 119925]
MIEEGATRMHSFLQSTRVNCRIATLPLSTSIAQQSLHFKASKQQTCKAKSWLKRDIEPWTFQPRSGHALCDAGSIHRSFCGRSIPSGADYTGPKTLSTNLWDPILLAAVTVERSQLVTKRTVSPNYIACIHTAVEQRARSYHTTPSLIPGRECRHQHDHVQCVASGSTIDNTHPFAAFTSSSEKGTSWHVIASKCIIFGVVPASQPLNRSCKWHSLVIYQRVRPARACSCRPKTSECGELLHEQYAIGWFTNWNGDRGFTVPCRGV